MDGRSGTGRHSSAVVDALNRDWVEILDRHDGGGDWCGRIEGLSGCRDLSEVVHRASRGCDTVLHALLVAAADGDRLAARAVLQSMLGRVVRMAGRDARSGVDEYVAALWCVLARYPLTARPVRIAANLALDTLKAVHREARWWPGGTAQAALPGDELEGVLDQWLLRSTLDHQVASSVGAAEVIEAGGRLRVVDKATGVLLRLVYVEGLTGVQAAARHGSTPGSVRVRCSRALARLSAHALDLVEAA